MHDITGDTVQRMQVVIFNVFYVKLVNLLDNFGVVNFLDNSFSIDILQLVSLVDFIEYF